MLPVRARFFASGNDINDERIIGSPRSEKRGSYQSYLNKALHTYVEVKRASKSSSTLRLDIRENKNTIKDNIQMNVYGLAVRDRFRKLPQRATFFYVNHGKTVDIFPEQEQIHRQKAALSAMINAVLDECFPELPNYQTCRSCSYQDLCEQKETKAA